LGEFKEGALNANQAFAIMRGNPTIEYKQLGLQHTLYSCEVLYNRGLCWIYNGNLQEGMEDLLAADKRSVLQDHGVIKDAIEAKGQVCIS